MRAGLRPHAWPPPRAAAKIAPWLGSTTIRQHSLAGSTARSPADGPARAPQVWRCSRATRRTAVSGESRWTRRRAGGGASSAAHPASAIAIDLGPDDLPTYVRTLKLISKPPDEPPFLNVQRFLKSIGSAVPEIYAADLKRRMLLVEDVGETSLFQAALRGSGEARHALSQRRGRASVDSHRRHAPARRRMYRRVDRIRRTALSMGDG